jgi:hypothetical protein
MEDHGGPILMEQRDGRDGGRGANKIEHGWTMSLPLAKPSGRDGPMILRGGRERTQNKDVGRWPRGWDAGAEIVGSEKGVVVPVQCGGILAAAEPAAEGVGGAGSFRLVLDVDVKGDAHEDADGAKEM